MFPAAPNTTTGPARSSGETHILALDGVRGIAVLTVICFHYLGGATQPNFFLHWFGNLLKFGYEGVTLFFILSGFLITGILWDTIRQPGSLKKFYIRRSLRILPLYYASILLCFAVGIAVRAPRGSLRCLWAVAFFCQNIGWNFFAIDNLPLPLSLNHFWSLGVEEHFYLIWPFLLLAVSSKKAARRVCLATLAVAVAAQIVYGIYWPPIFRFDYELFANAGALAIGGWLALARRDIWPRVAAMIPFVAVASCATFFALALRPPRLELRGPWSVIAGHMAITFFLASFVAGCLEPGVLARACSAAWLRFIGKISYGLYVYHLLFVPLINALALHLTGQVGPHYFIVRFAIVVVFLPTISWLSYRFFETPFLRLKNKFAPRTASLTVERQKPIAEAVR